MWRVAIGVFATLNQTIDEQYSNSAPQPLVIYWTSNDLCSNVVSPFCALPAAQKGHAARARGRGGRRASECAAGNAGAPRRPLHDCVSTLPPATASERVVAGWRRPGRARRLRFLYAFQLQFQFTIRLTPQSRDLMRMSLHSSAIQPSLPPLVGALYWRVHSRPLLLTISRLFVFSLTVFILAILFLNPLLRVYNQLSNFIFISKTQCF